LPSHRLESLFILTTSKQLTNTAKLILQRKDKRIKSLEKQLATQQIVNLALAMGLTALTAYTVLSPVGSQHFEHLTVKSMKVLEESGLPRIVIANAEFSPKGIYKGKEFVDVGSRPRMIFFNDEGTENFRKWLEA
jgi:hypothetical protein